ncbi:hypothetical protein K450DRAFT_229862 [Umbelopsis ramanniana AG]|uniref:Uncharacterized protein n=1 Tax=Umbelopsis ramanniana AG TaxID=1314678 RepID=A0AAD5HEZ7_UMBRA|nr:uncharacterized protein K450DRAFT_229862 [Umbelopsis ramanniana AG]KAI8581910.1 hypothetical protein K450DRAFT_229862 [Umbelopsis ramanniana AG]
MSHTPGQETHDYDAYAGQYPPPNTQYPATSNIEAPTTQYYPVYPPDQGQPQAYPAYPPHEHTATPQNYADYQDQFYPQNYSNNTSWPAGPHSTPQPQVYHTPPPPPQGPTPNNQSYPNIHSGYDDPHSVPLGGYREPDHEAYNGRQDPESTALLSAANNRRPSAKPEPMQEEVEYEDVDVELQEPTHLVAPVSYNRPDRDGFLPGERRRGAKPTSQGANDPATYLPKPYTEPSKGLCYGMTCCRMFCLLISVAFVAGGVALMIYSKVAKGNCDQALSGVKQAAQPLCDTVLYDALFYGGIAVTVLAGIGALWQLMMCLCARSR